MSMAIPRPKDYDSIGTSLVLILFLLIYIIMGLVRIESIFISLLILMTQS